jgi:hypothetical protein
VCSGNTLIREVVDALSREKGVSLKEVISGNLYLLCYIRRRCRQICLYLNDELLVKGTLLENKIGQGRVHWLDVAVLMVVCQVLSSPWPYNRFWRLIATSSCDVSLTPCVHVCV